MILKWALCIGVIGSLGLAQEAPAELPIFCEIHACLLDPDRDPCDPEEIKVQLVFLREDGDPEVVIPLDRGRVSDPARASLSWRVRTLEGTHFKIGIAGRSGYPAVAEGEKPGPRKEFLLPFKSPLLPEAETTTGEMDEGGRGVYFKVRLEAKTICDLAAGPSTKVILVFQIRGERKAIQCFTCSSKAKDGDKP